jgi:hypothetical protein
MSRNKQPANSRQPSKKGSQKRSYRNRVFYPTNPPETIDQKFIAYDDGSLDVQVNTFFGRLVWTYNPAEFKEKLTDHVQAFLDAFRQGVSSVSVNELEIDPDASKQGLRYADPVWQISLEKYSARAFALFREKLPQKMNSLPDLLVEQILYRLLYEIDSDIGLNKKSLIRNMWNDLGREYGKMLKNEWLKLKPGPGEMTSRSQRRELLRFYESVLPDCQNAKKLYKKSRAVEWKKATRKKYPKLEEEDVDNLVGMKPSDVALIVTGKHFKKIIGENFRGEDELKRQLGIARKEYAQFLLE